MNPNTKALILAVCTVTAAVICVVFTIKAVASDNDIGVCEHCGAPKE